MPDIQLNYGLGYAITEQVDMWMLGCILFTLAFYRHPFQDNATVMAIFNAKYFIPNDHPMAKSAKLCGLIHWLMAANPQDRPTAAHMCDLLREISKCTYADFLASMPVAVQDKINRLNQLFGKSHEKNAREPVPVTELVEAASAEAAKRRSTWPATSSEQQPSPPKNGLVATDPSPEEGGFDIRFALGPGTATGSTSPAHQQNATATPANEDLMSFTSAAPQQPPAPQRGSAQPFAQEDLLGFGPSTPAASPYQSEPTTAAPWGSAAASPTPNTANAGSFWNDFADFAAAPAATPSQPPSMPPITANGGPWAAHTAPSPSHQGNGTPNNFLDGDFADFASAPPPPSSAHNGNAGWPSAEKHNAVQHANPAQNNFNLLDL